MKTYLKLVTAFLAVCFMSVAAFAADASPSGTWKFSQPGRGGNAATERTLKLEMKDGKLTGTLMGTTGGNFQIPDTAIADASFKDGMIAFTVTNDINGNKRVTKFAGKVEGDSIKGTRETDRNGEAVKTDWAATRAN